MTSPLTSELQKILSHTEQLYGRQLLPTDIDRLSTYYDLVLKWNDHLHLTTITEPSAFASRHIFESIFAQSHLLPHICKVWDFGSGLGVPGIPIAVLRSDLTIALVEANKKKATFLKEAVDRLHLSNAIILNQRFETISEVEPESCVTARAIDEMSQALPKILETGKKCAQFLIFGGRETQSSLIEFLPQNRGIESYLIPNSQNRLLISLDRLT